MHLFSITYGYYATCNAQVWRARPSLYSLCFEILSLNLPNVLGSGYETLISQFLKRSLYAIRAGPGLAHFSTEIIMHAQMDKKLTSL